MKNWLVLFRDKYRALPAACALLLILIPLSLSAQTSVSTTTLTISICGDGLVNSGEECDVPGETGAYSTTIAGRQCSETCQFGPYCGDAILQTGFGEECDDGNNEDDDFCSAECLEETSDGGTGVSGGGGGGGGGSSGGGGSDTPLGDTEVSVEGHAYPNSTVNILIDGESVGTVRTNSSGEFLFNTETDPGTASLAFWATDPDGIRSATISSTFDITQGAVTNVRGISIPPSISVENQEVDPGDVVTISGVTVPEVTVEVSIDGNEPSLTTTSDDNGRWSVELDTSTISVDAHTLRARYVRGTTLRTESQYGTALSLFVGVDGEATSESDLNRDGSVNLTDFSILIFWWGTAGGDSQPPADINGNGEVSLEDFSILLFNWTG